MKTARVNLNTDLALRDLAAVFQNATGSMLGSAQKFGGLVHGGKFQYFTPNTSSAFAVLEEDPATFSVGVNIPKFNRSGDGMITLHMYIWDRGDGREVALISPYTLATGHSANKAIDRLVAAIQEQDPSARLIEA